MQKPIARLLLALIALVAAVTASAPVQKGKKVVLRVPVSALKAESYSLMRNKYIYGGEVTVGANGLVVRGEENWLGAGIPLRDVYKIQKVDKEKDGSTVVELWDANDVIKLRFKDAAALARFNELVISEGDTAAIDAHMEAAQTAVATRFFVSKGVPAESARKIVAALDPERVSTIEMTQRKEQDYFTMQLLWDRSYYNNLKVNQPQRVARDIVERILPVVKALGPGLRGAKEGLAGIALKMNILHRNAVTNGDEGRDEVTMYIPSDLAAQFADADISAQKLVDGSVVLVNDNRFDVTLSDQ